MRIVRGHARRHLHTDRSLSKMGLVPKVVSLRSGYSAWSLQMVICSHTCHIAQPQVPLQAPAAVRPLVAACSSSPDVSIYLGPASEHPYDMPDSTLGTFLAKAERKGPVQGSSRLDTTAGCQKFHRASVYTQLEHRAVEVDLCDSAQVYGLHAASTAPIWPAKDPHHCTSSSFLLCPQF